MSTTATGKRQRTNTATLTQKYLEMPNQDFGQHIDQIWQSLSKIIGATVTEVESGGLPPMVGGQIVAAAVGSAFAYEEFNPRGDMPSLPAASFLAGSDS